MTPTVVRMLRESGSNAVLTDGELARRWRGLAVGFRAAGRDAMADWLESGADQLDPEVRCARA